MRNRTIVSRSGRGGRGFTLLEVMIVIVIILAILGLVAVNLMGAKKKADTGITQIALNNLKGALIQFNLDFNRYPAEDGEGLAALWNKSVVPAEEQSKWREGGYTTEPMPRDQWGSDWGYRLATADSGSESNTTSGPGFTLWSNGPDKQEGTTDDVYPGNKKPDELGGTSSDDVGPPSSTGK